jgi:hypothetical protein
LFFQVTQPARLRVVQAGRAGGLGVGLLGRDQNKKAQQRGRYQT